MKKFTKRSKILIFSFITLLFVGYFSIALYQVFEEFVKDELERIKIAHGPSNIMLIDQGSLFVPKGFMFFSQESQEIDDIQDLGHFTIDSEGISLWGGIDYIKSGYVRVSSEDVKNLDASADKLLKIMKEDAKRQNPVSVKDRLLTYEVVGWVQKPTYDFSKHQATFSYLFKDLNGSDNDQWVVYNAYLFGRDGFFRVTISSYHKDKGQAKLYFQKVLSKLKYNSGKSYKDFVEGKDNVAAKGLAAIISDDGL